MSARRRRSQLRGLAHIALALALALPHAAAADRLYSSPFGPLVEDILTAFDAEVVPCVSPVAGPEVCFVVHILSPTYLASELEAVLEQHRHAGVNPDAWETANGVWRLSVKSKDVGAGQLLVYLAQAGTALVRGVLVLDRR